MEVSMMSWAWLNIPLGVMMVLAIAGIPIWLVLKRPAARPELAAVVRPDLGGAAQPSRDRAHQRTPAARIPLRAGPR
jgi:hypothetical protein